MENQMSNSINSLDTGHFFICVIEDENNFSSSSINGVL